MLTNFSGGGSLNSSSLGITTGLTTALAVKSGISQSTDIIYFGTSKKLGITNDRWGLFKSINGGKDFTHFGGNLSGVSIFSIALDPQNQNNVVIGTVGDGIFHSRNGGATWNISNNNVYANSGLSFTQNPSNPNHMIFSSSIGAGLGRNYFTLNSGNSWVEFPHVDSDDGESTFNIDPSDSKIILAGTFANGVYRSNDGVNGPWTKVLNQKIKIDKIIRNKLKPQHVYALSSGPNLGSNPEVTLYYSGNSGASFISRPATFANDLTYHPINVSEAVIASFGDVYASTNFFSTKVSLGLSSASIQEGGSFSAVAFDPNQPNVLLAGGSKGGVYKTVNYNSSGSDIVWKKLITPIKNAVIRKLVIVKRGNLTSYYVAAFGADVFYSPDTTTGLFKSSDGGVTWTQLSDGLFPSNAFWHFQPDSQTNSIFYGSMWGGGVMRLVDQL